MLVDRRTFFVKRGRMEEAAPLLKSIMTRYHHPLPVRVYAPYIGSIDLIALEIEFENLVQYQSFWDEWYARPESSEALKKWYDITEPGSEQVIWSLAE